MIVAVVDVLGLAIVGFALWVTDRDRRRLERMADEIRARQVHPTRRAGDVPAIRMLPRGDRKVTDS